MDMCESDVPQWKKDLILKKQKWKGSQGWSVPPVATPVRPSISSFQLPSEEIAKTTQYDKTTDYHDNIFPVSAFKDIDQPMRPKNDDVFVIAKPNSSGNLLNGKPAEENPARAITTMEDLFKKYRKETPKKSAVTNLAMEPVHERINLRKRTGDEPIYFLDMDKNELPSPSTVKETVKVFQTPNQLSIPLNGNFDRTPSPLIQNIVFNFEAKIESTPVQKPFSKKPQLPRSPSIPDAKTEIPSKPLKKHVTFNPDVDHPSHHNGEINNGVHWNNMGANGVKYKHAGSPPPN